MRIYLCSRNFHGRMWWLIRRWRTLCLRIVLLLLIKALLSHRILFGILISIAASWLWIGYVYRCSHRNCCLPQINVHYVQQKYIQQTLHTSTTHSKPLGTRNSFNWILSHVYEYKSCPMKMPFVAKNSSFYANLIKIFYSFINLAEPDWRLLFCVAVFGFVASFLSSLLLRAYVFVWIGWHSSEIQFNDLNHLSLTLLSLQTGMKLARVATKVNDRQCNKLNSISCCYTSRLHSHKRLNAKWDSIAFNAFRFIQIW